MKKTIYAFLLIFLMISANTSGQMASLAVSPQSQCFSVFGNSSSASVAVPIPGATSYSWSIMSPPSCTATYTALASGTAITVFYPCCGTYTIIATGWNGAIPIGQATQTAAVLCASVSVTPNTIGICLGSSAFLMASGGTSYTWSSNNPSFSSNSPSIVVTPTVSTYYFLTGTNSAGCIDSAFAYVSVTPASPINISGNTSICAGSSTTLTASGAQSYTWQPGNLTGAGIVVSPSVSTCYTVTGSSPGGCVVSTVKCVTVQPGSQVTITGPNSICSGSYAILQASGGTSYTWMPGGLTSPSIVVTPTTTTCYTVLSNGCSGQTAAIKCLTVNPTPFITISGNLSICPGQTTTLTASGASSYSWMIGSSTYTGSTVVISPLSSICFSVIGTTGNGCVGVTGACINTNGGNVTVSGPSSSICAGQSATLTASGLSTYTWQPGNLTGSSIVVTPTAAMTCYTVTGTSTTGCTGSAISCVTVQTSPNIFVSGNSFICAGDSTVLVASGGVSYTWQPGNIISSSIAVSPTATTCYTVTGLGTCSTTASFVRCVTVNPATSLTVSGPSSICQGGSAFLIASGGAFNYTWSPGGAITPSIVVSPTATTCYTVNAYGCSGNLMTAVKCISVSPGVTVSGPTSICSGTGAVLVANGSQSYTWQPGNLTGSVVVVSPSVSTCYTVTGSTSCGISSAVHCINVQQSGSLSISGPNSICSGGSAFLLASGGASNSYTWSTGAVTPSILVSPAVTTCYSVSAFGCFGNLMTAVKCVSVTPGSSVTVSGPNSICSGSFAILQATGGTSYTWSPGALTSSSIIVTPTATTCYTVIANGCSGLTYAVKCVTVNPSPVISVSGNLNICAGSSTTLTASGASTYSWMTGSATFTGSTVVLTPSASTCFSLIGQNASGCYGVSGVCINVSQNSNITIASSANSICSGGSITLFANGGSSYTWQPGGSNAGTLAVSPSVTTCYTLTGMGCSGLGAAVKCITVNPKPTISTFPTSTLCIGQPGGLMATGANSYTWLPYNQTGSVIAITPTASACYTVIGTSALGCTNSAVSCYSAFPALNITISGPNVSCAGQTTTLTASGGVNYVWQPGNITGASIVVSPTASTCYTVTGFGGFNCPGTAVRCMSVQPAPIVTVNGNTSICAGSSTSLAASGAATYTWIPGNLTGPVVVVSPSVSTCYTVVGANANGCIGVSNACIQVKPKPVLVTSGGIFCANQSDSLFASGASTYTWMPFNYTGPIVMITPSVSGCYTVVGTNSVGCTNSVVGCYSVMPSPVITVTGNSVICAGASSTLTASGGSNYLWLPGGQTGASIVVSPSVTTCYTVLSTNPFGCISKTLKCVIVQQGAPLNISGTSLICAGSCANLLASGASTYTWSNGSNSPLITVCPTVSTCYTLTGTTAQGCIGTAVKCIQVQPQPFVTVTGNTSICQGTSTNLMASGASAYVWSTGSTANNITVAPSVSTTYTVTGSNGSCSSTRTVNVMVKPRPNITIMRTDSASYQDSLVCAGEQVMLTAAGAVSYTWSNGSTFPSILVTPSSSTAYTVVGTGANGCTNGNVYVLFVSPCAGLAQHSSDALKIGVYPNPSHGHIFLQHEGSNVIKYAVYDVIGRELVKGEFSGTKDLDLSGYANGSYVIRFGSGPDTFYKKLVLEK